MLKELEKTPAYEIPLGLLSRPAYNPRKYFDKVKLDELAANIKAVGVLQPVLCRPKAADFELVFGERRVRASKLAGLATVPARVVELSDLQVAEFQVYENGQRDDVHPLEESDAFARLHKPPKGATYAPQAIEEIAAKAGKSRAYVYQALKLQELGEVGRKLFLDGKLTKSTADLVARVQPMKLQDQAAKSIGNYNGGGMPFRQAFEEVKRNFMLAFEGCGFDLADAELVPKAGPCTVCPKRSGNQLELVGDVKAPDRCLDSVCFKSKQEAAWKKRVEAEQEKGREVISDTKAKEVFHQHYNDVRHDAGFVRLDDECRDDPKRRTYKELLKDAEVPVTVARNPHDGKPVELIPSQGLKKAIADAGHKWARPAAKSKNRLTTTKAPAVPPDYDVRRATNARVAAALVDKVVKAGSPSKEILRFVVLGYVRNNYDDYPACLERRIGPDDEDGELPEERLKPLVDAMDVPELLGLAVEMLLEGMLNRGPYALGNDMPGLAKLAGVDYAALKKDVARELKERMKCIGCGKPNTKPAVDGTNLCLACGATGKWTLTDDGWMQLEELEEATA